MVGAALWWAALPPLELGPLAWIAPVSWLLLVRRNELAGKRPYRALWLAGFLLCLANFHWLRFPHWATIGVWIGVTAVGGSHLPVFVWLGRVAVHRLRVPLCIVAPVTLVAIELLAQLAMPGSMMCSLAHTQYRWITLIQASDLAGAYGISFLVMFVAACLARMIPLDGRPATAWPLLPALAVMGGALLYGHVRTSGPPAPCVARVAIVQGRVDVPSKSDPAKQPMILQDYLARSRAARAEWGPLDCILWPETSFGWDLVTYDRDVPSADVPDGAKQQWDAADQKCRAMLASVAREIDAPLLTGIARRHHTGTHMSEFNAAVLVAPDGELLGRYDKIFLVMFGEHVPLGETFPWLNGLIPGSLGRTAGTTPAAFRIGPLRIAPNICYECALGEELRWQVNALAAAGDEPDVLVNLSNVNWFRGSTELEMHLACGVFRAVELRKPMLMAVNAGISASIDGNGRIRAQAARFADDAILAEVCLDHRGSLFRRYGNWLADGCVLACVAIGVLGCRRKRCG